ncbi:helix-turn-helix domain-containing protein [Salipaludibacillus neizhouensis]|uniref:helix-turn-helix domain-containing protein n=1 Tax=Salipaludibacillus neizhouensis TaxID=885475 RepID=UPI001CBA61FD|nr:helix-turn-helix domain-containing protein [Salipaludibacillus neizhouensis]
MTPKKIINFNSLGLGKSTVSRLISTLSSEGFVVRIPEIIVTVRYAHFITYHLLYF